MVIVLQDGDTIKPVALNLAPLSPFLKSKLAMPKVPQVLYTGTRAGVTGWLGMHDCWGPAVCAGNTLDGFSAASHISRPLAAL